MSQAKKLRESLEDAGRRKGATGEVAVARVKEEAGK